MIKIIIYGAGGHAKSVIDSIDPNLYEVVGFIDNYKKGFFLNKPIYDDSFLNLDIARDFSFFVAIGDNNKRYIAFKKIVDRNLELVTIIDKTAIISSSASYGKGCYFGKYSILNADAMVGDNVIVNTRALIEHECKVGNSCHISTNSTVNGGSIIGDYTFVGSSSILIGQLSIGSNVIIGAGAVVIRDCEDNSTYVGVPARKIK